MIYITRGKQKHDHIRLGLAVALIPLYEGEKMNPISSTKNDDIKYLKKLYKTRKRKQRGKFVLEGARIINEAYKADADLEKIFMTPDYNKDKLNFDLSQIDVKYVEKNLLEKIADTVSPQGIIAVVNEFQYRLNNFSEKRSILVLDRIQDPGNMGTLIRTAVAAGIEGIIALKGCVDIYNLKVIRSTMGAIFKLPILAKVDFNHFHQIYNNNFNLITADLSGEYFHHELQYEEPLMLVVGNEANGVRSQILKLSDYIVKIPIIGEIDSLNAAIAGGIILF